ncbi:hypothetical protein [Amnibacterium kyonggiense]|uniref:Uncharacterized protein n=1 Tax=Amnibacterium kyonggiense TaxID=595671 RepID=A0A4R7FJ80_9MICO|nr:hypothetical protein [Amnibacterium kyonggiense]TDS75806.1 hypothetical protein CLV52_2915 [Amnibacterium kyonggiense]
MADDQQITDELVPRDLPGKLAILVFAVATLALLRELVGILAPGISYVRPLADLDLGDIAGVGLFTAGWFGLLVGLLVLRHRRDASSD